MDVKLQRVLNIMRQRPEPCNKVAQSKIRESEMTRLDTIVAKLGDGVTRSSFIRACLLAGMDDVEKSLD
jgi:hypothetical protein